MSTPWGGTHTQRVSTMKDLGIIVDSKMSFRDHVDDIVAGSMRALGLLVETVDAS